MDDPTAIPKGIWYEKARNRWRVKLVHEGILLHRSYHKDYDDALVAWTETKRSIRHPCPLPKASLLNQFLCQPLVGASRVRGH